MAAKTLGSRRRRMLQNAISTTALIMDEVENLGSRRRRTLQAAIDTFKGILEDDTI